MSEFNPNENQKEAIYYDGDEPLIIEAGPGSGKTRVLTERVKFLLNEKKVDPTSLLIITFTRKATEELKNRLAKYISSDVINKIQISTIHGFCYELLKKNSDFAYEILDDDNDQKKTLFIQKNKDKLGFNGYSYISNGNISNIIKKYSEYSTFNVDSEGLVNYICENKPVSDEFKKLVDESENGKFPYTEVKKSEDLDDAWHNARYLQIAKSYNEYLKLLKKNYLVDYDTLQINTLNFLDENPKTQFTNILIDEFQDVNPVQYEIFKKLIPYADSFTVVGDVDQSIYGFRGALFDYFEDLERDYNGHKISLDINYRSSENVVNLTEEFIRPYRAITSKKNMKNNRVYNNNCYYTITDDDEEEVNILKFIKEIKNQGKIKKYSDIAILFRSLQGKMVKDLIELLEAEDIPYDIRNFSKIIDNDDVKSLVMLLFYIAPFEDNSPYFSKIEREWLNLRGFAGDKFQPTLWSFSEETCDVLRQLQDDFEDNALNVAKEVYENETGMKAGIRSFSGLFNNDNKFSKNKTDEIMKKIFGKAPRPQIDLNLIKNTKDREFFQKLNDLKLLVNANVRGKITTHLEKVKNNYKKEYDSKYNNRRLEFSIDLANKNEYYVKEGVVDKLEEFKSLANENKLTNDEAILRIDEIIEIVKGYDDRLTVLDIFYKLLDITDFFKNCSDKSFNNFADIAESMYNFESVMDADDLTGYFNFLKNNAEDWDEQPVEDSVGVQIMTVHKSKGLEFPVVIVPNIGEDSVPKQFQDPSEVKFKYPNFTYYTPNEFLRYKQNLKHDDEYYYDLEEKRILYVAMTRAQDSLLISFLNDVHPLFDSAVDKGLLKPLDYSTFSVCEKEYEVNDEEVLNASYTSLKAYEDCPYRYNLIYEHNFKVSENEDIRAGSFIHDVFNKINVDKIENPQLSDEKIGEIIEKVYGSTSNISYNDEELEEYKNKIFAFYKKIEGYNILESEYSFSIINDEYNIVGSIDLIYENNGKIGIIDYKNTVLEGDDIDRYKNQLKIYLHALSLDSKYNDKIIEEAGIYGIKTDNLVLTEISSQEINDYMLDVSENVKKIKNKEFPPNKNDYYCKNCKFNFICD